MKWLATFLAVAAAFLHATSASFLSTIDEYRKIDSNKAALKRHGRFNEPPTDGSDRPQYGGDDFGNEEEPNCDVVMAQCQCDNGGGGGGGGGGRSPTYPRVAPVPQVQKRHGGPSRKRHGNPDGSENEYVNYDDDNSTPAWQPDGTDQNGDGSYEGPPVEKRQRSPPPRKRNGPPPKEPNLYFYNTTLDEDDDDV